MSKSKITSTIDYLSDPRKAITAAVLLVLVIAAIAFVWRKVSGLWKNSSYSVFDDPNVTSSINFGQLALRMYDATNRFGTDEEEVFNVLAVLQTQADYTKLCGEWTKLYDEKGFWHNLTAKSTLPGTLQSELSSIELSRARNILTEKGIAPDF